MPSGFTLLELMVSITLLAIIIAVISGAARLGYRSVESGEKKIEALERYRMCVSLIDAQIQSATQLTYDDQGAKLPYFKGERDSMNFSTNYSIWTGEKGFVVVTYKIVQDEKAKLTLYASEGIIGLSTTKTTKLFEGFDEMYFEYLYRDPTQEKPSWVNVWPDDTSTPQRVAVKLVKGRNAYSFIIPMRTGGMGASVADKRV